MTYSPASSYLDAFLFRLGTISIVSLFLVGSVAAQSAAWSATTGTTPTSMSPGAPAGSYALTNFENVNLFNSRLNFDLPLVHVGGRGAAGFTVHLPIGNQWSEFHYSAPGSCGQGGCGPWVQYTIPTPNDWKYLPAFSPGVMAGRQAAETPVASCGSWSTYAATLTRLTFTDADGTEHEFRDDLYDGQPKPTTCSTTTNRGRNFHTSDGTAATFISDSDIYDPTAPTSTILTPSGYLLFPDGTRYRIDNGNVSWLRDRNGNKITFGGAAAITDSLGRQVTVTTTSSYYEIAFAGVGGSVTRYIRVYTDLLGNSNLLLPSGAIPQSYHSLFPYLPNASSAGSFNPTVVSRVVLPDGRQYSFKYNVYGEMVRIDLPTGGRIEYDYAQPETQSVHHYVTERRVYTDAGITMEGKTRYAGGQVDHLTANDVLLSREVHLFYGTPYGEDLFNNHPSHYSPWNQGREYSTAYYAADGTTLLRSVTRNWQQSGPVSWWGSGSGPEPQNNPRVVETVTTLNDTNQVTKTTSINPQTGAIGFDQFNNQTDSWEYDYGTGTPSTYPLRHTHTDYLTTNPANGIDYTLYTGAHIRNLPSGQKIYSVNQSNGSEALVAQGTTSYDETAYPLLTYASVTGWTDPGTNARGNATTTSSWLNTNSSWLSTHAQYDQLGNVRKLWDAKDTSLLNPTQISYTDSFSDSVNRNTYALATSVTSPIPDSTGVYGSTSAFSVSTIFDFSTGAVISTTDINNQTASMQYNDLLDRPTQLRLAVGNALTHQTTITYDDANKTITTTSDVITNNDNALKGQMVYDGLGRTIETHAYENSTQYITVKQIPFIPVQDPDTGAWVAATQVSNPYRAYASEQPVWTKTFSDALGRTTKVQTPDSAVARTSFSGNAVTASDQTGKSRKSVMDALGRLSKVYEDPTGSNFLTSYEYDVLGSLTKVTQDTQTPRTFAYDSLKRLTSAYNPESGTVGYLYDSNGNITQRTDARGVVSYYGYDAINRPITRTYSDSTPGVTYKYDSASGVTNAKGRIVSVASSVSTANIGGYDALGRVTSNSQTLGSQTYALSYSYDLAGHVLSETYPSNHTVNYNYDQAGRLGDKDAQHLAFTGNLGDGTARTYSAGIIYSSLGGMTKEQFGTDTAIYNKLFYNVRGQLAEIRESTTYTDPNDTSWNRGAIINHYSNNCWGMCGGSNSTTPMTDNNGNLKKQEHQVPDDEQVSTAQVYLSSYSYDSLNRLQSVNEGRYIWGQGSPSQSVTQAYVYDRWGNRTIDYNATSSNLNRLQFSVNANNQLGVPNGQSGSMTYDNAGNLTNDTYSGGGTRTYDAENRMTAAQEQTSSYTYDAGGQRVKRKTNNVETWQVYGLGGELVAEYAANGSPTAPQKEYGYRNGQLLITATNTAGDVHWLVTDQLGTPRMIFDKSGTFANTKRHDYLPFGEEQFATTNGRTTTQGYTAIGYLPADGARQHFTGYERDAESGLDYAHARYYGNVQGRFTSPDPFAGSASIASPQTFNRYAYVGNNPVNSADPTGLFVENTNPHSCNTFFGDGDDSVGSQIPGHSKNQFIHEAVVPSGTLGLAGGLIAGAALSGGATAVSTPQDPGSGEGTTLHYWPALIWRDADGNEVDKSKQGHIALQLSDGTYISYWPGEHLGPIDIGKKVEPSMHRKYIDDYNGEHKTDSQTFTIYGLNEAKIKEWWNNGTGHGKFYFPGNDCSDIVTEALRQGGLSPRTNGELWHNPESVWNGAKAAVQTRKERRRPMTDN